MFPNTFRTIFKLHIPLSMYAFGFRKPDHRGCQKNKRLMGFFLLIKRDMRIRCFVVISIIIIDIILLFTKVAEVVNIFIIIINITTIIIIIIIIIGIISTNILITITVPIRFDNGKIIGIVVNVCITSSSPAPPSPRVDCFTS